MKVQEDQRARDEFASFLSARGYESLPDDEKVRLWDAFLWARAPDQPVMRFVLDGPPTGPDSAGRFVETEDAEGQSIRSGRWHEDARGRWVLEVAPSRGGLLPPA